MGPYCISTPAARTVAALSISCLTVKYDASSAKNEHRITGLESVGQTTKLPRHRLHLPMPCRTQDAFYFIQIEFKRCNVRCTNAILPDW